MSKTECDCFEMQLAYHTAPSLLGIKCASLFSIRSCNVHIDEQINLFNEKAKSKHLKIRLLCKCKSRTLLLLYNEKMMADILSDKINRELLEEYGYSSKCSLETDLEILSERIANEKEFPHEIGIFLGYPKEDVIGFIESKGKNCKFCGCWKVYGDVENAKRTFSNYNKCRKFLCDKLNQGIDIYGALKIS